MAIGHCIWPWSASFTRRRRGCFYNPWIDVLFVTEREGWYPGGKASNRPKIRDITSIFINSPSNVTLSTRIN